MSVTTDTARSAGWATSLRSDVVENVGSVRVLEFLAGLLLFTANQSTPFISMPLPISYLAVVGLVGVAAFRRPQIDLRPIGWMPWAFGLLLVYLAVVSALADPTEYAGDWKRRLIRLALVTMLVFSIAGSRIDLMSLLKGIGAGLMANVVLYYAGLAPDNYPGFLTGFLNDKNQAGLAYAVYGLLMLSLVRRSWTRVGVLVVFAVLLFLTGSRTSMAGFAVGVIWLVASPRLSNPFRWGLAGVLAYAVWFIESHFARIGIFANRDETDWFRAQLEALTQAKLAQAPWQGMGLGEAYVLYGEGPVSGLQPFYFHSAYASLQVEGGWVYLLAVVGITVLYGLRPARRGWLDSRSAYVEAATVALLVCGWKLGEVFYTVVWGIVMACALQVWLAERSAGPQPIRLPRSLRAIPRGTDEHADAHPVPRA